MSCLKAEAELIMLFLNLDLTLAYCSEAERSEVSIICLIDCSINYSALSGMDSMELSLFRLGVP